MLPRQEGIAELGNKNPQVPSSDYLTFLIHFHTITMCLKLVIKVASHELRKNENERVGQLLVDQNQQFIRLPHQRNPPFKGYTTIRPFKGEVQYQYISHQSLLAQ